ncbi:MAG: glycosyltransferase [Flavobacteriales bacterium]|nr:glycosyltransferase [Flavobacteriales bacterium]
MKFILTSIGTRGDMEPFLAIGEILKEKGHEVICMFPEQFKKLSDDSGFEFISLGEEFIDLINSPEGRIAMAGGSFGFRKFRAYLKLIQKQKSINSSMIQKQFDAIERLSADRIIHNGKVIYPVIWSIKNPGKTVLISPVPYLHYVKDHAHVAFNKDFGPFINKLTYKLANYGLVKTIMNSVKEFEQTQNTNQKEVQSALFSNKAIYTISPTLFERPLYWRDNLQVLGYHERNKVLDWRPSENLRSFLKRHEKICFVTFGSMVNDNPSQKTEIILKVLEKNRIPAIINTAAGGLVQPKEYNTDLFHFVTRIPYDWIFPKIYAVIHHGGSGTTHTALKNGCASLIIPHIIDQYIWNTIIASKGAGPKGVDISKLNEKRFEKLALDVFNKPSYKEAAQKLGEIMSQEDFKDDLYNSILN